MKNTQKGAMFGLDARIALAIFGALSVISGAALYSAIQTAKAEAIRQEITNLSKSIEQYILDTGGYLKRHTFSNSIYIGELHTNFEGVPGWNGPYANKPTVAINQTNIYIKLDITGDSSLDNAFLAATGASSSWGGPSITDYNALKACSGSDCQIYLRRNIASSSTNSFNKLKYTYEILENLVDNNDGAGTGNVRGFIAADGSFHFYYRVFSNFYRV